MAWPTFDRATYHAASFSESRKKRVRQVSIIEILREAFRAVLNPD